MNGGGFGMREVAFPGSERYPPPSINASDELVDFLVGNIPSAKLADFHSADDARQRIWTLIEQEKQSGLLPEEKLELEDYLKLEHLLVLAKAKARLSSRHAG